MKLIVRLVTVFVIVVLAVGIAMAVSGDTFGLFGALSDKDSYSERLTWTAEETLETVRLDVDVRKVDVVLTDGPFVSIDYHAHDDDTWTFDLSGSVLQARQRHRRSFAFFSFGIVPQEFRTVTLHLPRSSTHGLEIHTDVGDITLDCGETLTLSDLDIDSDTGTVTLHDVSVESGIRAGSSTGRVTMDNVVANDVEVDVSTGRVTLSDFAFGTLSVDNSTGDVILENGVVTGALDVDNSTGRIEIDDVLAQSYDLRTSTGDIIFSATSYDDLSMELSTDVGRVSVFGDDQGKSYVDSTGSVTLKAKVSTGSITVGR
jgi:hypothetical protein